MLLSWLSTMSLPWQRSPNQVKAPARSSVTQDGIRSLSFSCPSLKDIQSLCQDPPESESPKSLATPFRRIRISTSISRAWRSNRASIPPLNQVKAPARSSVTRDQIRSLSFSCPSFKDIQSLCQDPPESESPKSPATLFRRIRISTSISRASIPPLNQVKAPARSSVTRDRIRSLSFSCPSFKDIQSLCQDPPESESPKSPATLFRRILISTSISRAWGSNRASIPPLNYFFFPFSA